MKRILYYFTLIVAIATAVACDKDGDGEIAIAFTPGSDLTPEFNAEGGSEKYTFTTKYDWTIEVFDEWVHVTPESGTALVDSFILKVDGHDNGEERTSHITLHLSNGQSVEIPIVQAMCERYDVEPTEAYIIDAEGGGLDIEISTNLEYMIEIPIGTKWIKLSDTRSMYSETLHFEIEENLSTKSRVAHITALDIRYDNPIIHTFTVVQSARNEAQNEILYTSATNSRIELNTTEGFGAKFSVHLFDGGMGRIIFDDEISTIPEGAFAYESGIQSITLPQSVHRIEDRAFDGCSSLTEVNLPESVGHIGSRALAGCTSCKEFTMPASVASIGGSLFDGCSGTLTINCTIPKQKYEVNEDSTITIDDSHWLYGSTFEVVTANNRLGVAAFANYKPLKKITFGDRCTGVGNRAFEGCNVESVVVRDVATWCNISFANATANPLHTGNNDLIIDGETVRILDTPTNVKSIGGYSFYNYQNLNKVRINSGVSSINMGAFGACKLESIYLGTGIRGVGVNAFNECECKTLTIDFDTPNFNVSSDKSNHWLHGLKANRVVFGSNVTKIGNHALSALDMETIEIGDNVTYIGIAAFAYCTNLKNVTLGSGITQISQHLFFRCHNLQSITLPNETERIEDYAFQHTGLQSIIIPADVTFIGEYCFYDCTSLNVVYCTPTAPPTLGNEYVFPKEGTTIYVPANSLKLYTEAKYWTTYQAQLKGYNF